MSITKPQASSRLGITLGSGEESLLHISSLAPDALGAKSGELEVGDALLAVNGVLVYNHLEASTMIKETAGTVHLTIKRPSTPPTATVATAAATTAAAVTPAPAPAQTPTSPDVAGAPSDAAAAAVTTCAARAFARRAPRISLSPTRPSGCRASWRGAMATWGPPSRATCSTVRLPP